MVFVQKLVLADAFFLHLVNALLIYSVRNFVIFVRIPDFVSVKSLNKLYVSVSMGIPNVNNSIFFVIFQVSITFYFICLWGGEGDRTTYATSALSQIYNKRGNE